jgi:hypothetical protein
MPVIVRYLGMLDTADRQESQAAELRTARLTTRLDELRRQMRELEAMEAGVAVSPDRQISLTDPDARAMASAGAGTGIVGYNVQAAVDTGSHIVVAPVRADAEQVADQQHPKHKLRIDRGPPGRAIACRQGFAHEAKIQKALNASQQVISRQMVVEPKPVEQCTLRHLLTHHALDPLSPCRSE